MGFGQSKKKESLESVQTDRGSRSDRGSKHSSNYSDDSERFVSPPTSLVNGFNTNLFEFPSRSNAIVKPTSDCHDAQDGVTPCICHTKTVPRPSTGKLETKATITFQDETAKHSSHGKPSTTLQKALQNQGVKDVKKTNRVNNHNGETQPNKSRPIGGNNNHPDTAKFGKGGKDKPHPTASSIQERPDQQQHFNVGRLQDGQQLQKGTQPSEQGQQQQRLQQRQQQTQLQTEPQQSLQQQTRHKHQEKQVQLNLQVHQQQEQQQGQNVLSTSDEGPQQHQQLGRQKPSQQQHKPPMQEPNQQQKNHQLSKERVCVQQQQKQTEQNEKQHINEQQKLSLQKQPKEEKPQLVQQQPNKQQKHSVHLHDQQQAEAKLQQHNNVSDQQQQLQHNLKEKQTKLPQCQPQQNKQPPTPLLQRVPHHNQPRMQSQAQQQQQQLSQQQQKEKLPEEKQQKKGRQQEKLPPQQPLDQQRIEEKSSKKTKKLSKKEQRALDWKQKQGESNQCDLQQPNENQLHQQSQKLNHTDLPEQNARQGKEEPHQQSTIQVQGTPKPLPQQQINHPQDTREQEQLSNKVAIKVRLTYEADNKNSSKHHVVEDTLKGKPIPLMAITFPKHGANCALLRTSNLQATAMDSYTPVNSTTSGASKERVGKTTPLSVETMEVSDHSPDNTTITQSETSKKISKRPLTPFFPRKKKSLENCQNTSTDDAFERDLNQKDNGEKQRHPKNQQQHRKENEQQHQQKQQEQNQQQQHLQQQKDNQQEHQQLNQQQQHLQQQKDKQQQHQNQQRQQQKQPEHQQQLPSKQQGQQDQPQSVTPFVFQGKERPKLKPVHRLPDQHPPEFSTRAAVLQAQFSLNQPSPSPKTARKQKPVEGDAQMEKFKLIQKNDSTASTMKKSDCCAMNFQDSSVTVTHCVAPWAIVCDKMPDQVFSDTPLVGKKLKKKTKCKTSKTSHREGHGFFSKIFGKKTTTEKNKPKQDCSETPSAEMERLTQHMEDLRLSSSTSVHQDDATKCEAGTRIAEVTPSTPEQEPDQDSESTAEDSDSSTDLEPPSCVEAWEIAEDVVEKALFLLPVPTAGKYVVPDSPFEPEFVKRLVADALEAKRGLKKVKEDQKLMEKFRDALLKFFEDKEISDVVPPCNHPPGTNQCNLQPVIQPLVDILRQVLHEPKVANDQPKNELETQREAKRQSESQQPRPRKYIKVRRRLKTGQAPTQLLIRFCQACGDTKQPDGRKLMSCGRCKDVVYCSKECQSVDWITHKFTCRGGDRRGYCKHHGT